jgi:L-ascorbate metabolism protein UlaG (beta-lactamase superfamily)
MKKSGRLRLSPFIQPKIQMGVANLVPSNLSGGEDRLLYLDNLLQYLQKYLELTLSRAPEDSVQAIVRRLAQIPFTELLVDIGREKSSSMVREKENARDRIRFDRSRLTLAFMDGRDRDEDRSLRFELGAETPLVRPLIAALIYGVSEEQLKKILSRLPRSGKEIVRLLKERGMLEYEKDSPFLPAPSFQPGPEDSLTWVGHAMLSFRAEHRTVWVDPVFRPRIAWSSEDLTTLFSKSFVDQKFFRHYDQGAQPIPIAEFPPPDAVCITHPDNDHFDPGALMCLPKNLPIIIPEHSGNPWDPDMGAFLRNVLGPDRNVIPLSHGKSVKIGRVKITAFPFKGEMPNFMNHLWNCYLLETPSSAVACTADAMVDDAAVDFVIQRLRRQPKNLVFCGRIRRDENLTHGYFDDYPEGFFNMTRLWPWYLPVARYFDPSPRLGVTYKQLDRINKTVGLKFFMSYAEGSTPWSRIKNRKDSFFLKLSSPSISEWNATKKRLKQLDIALFPYMYGEPVSIS